MQRCSFNSEEGAQSELAAIQEYDESANVVQTIRACPASSMQTRLGFETSVLNALDIVATFWVEDETELDGVWWDDSRSPEHFSAPRGVIVGKALPRWTVTKTSG